MPRLPTDYSKNINYKLCCLDPTITDIYIGQTTEFTKRKNNHKFRCNNESNHNHNQYVYQFIRENGGWNNWSMIQIEEYPCNNKREAEARERYWYEELNATLNSQKPIKTKNDIQIYNKLYYVNNNNKIKSNVKQYTEKNNDTIREYQKQYREKNKDNQKEYMKKYQATEKSKEYRKQYYEKKKNSTILYNEKDTEPTDSI